MNPKVTVLMPVYNGVRFLQRAIESILCQTEKDFELIIIDDGSTEPVWDVLNLYYGYPRIVLIQHRNNRGMIVRLNQGLDLAHGDYIARQDADDYAEPHRLERQLAKFAIPNVGFVGCWGQSINEEGQYITEFVDIHCRCNDNDLVEVYPHQLCMIDASVVYSRVAVEKVGYYDSEVLDGESYNYTRRVQQFFEGRVVQEMLYYRTMRYDSVMRRINHKGIDVIALANERARTHPIIRRQNEKDIVGQ